MTDLQKRNHTGPKFQRTLIEELLKQQTPVSFRAAGPSMNPTIRSGDLVHITPVANGRLRLGSILLFQQAGRLTLHRYVKAYANPTTIGTAGDAAVVGLDIVSRNDVYGVAEWVEHGRQRVRLNSWGRRWSGLLRFHTRPFRRFMIKRLQARRTRPSRQETRRE